MMTDSLLVVQAIHHLTSAVLVSGALFALSVQIHLWGIRIQVKRIADCEERRMELILEQMKEQEEDFDE